MPNETEQHIKVELTLFETNQGGRRGPTPKERFGCPIRVNGRYLDVRFDLSEVGTVVPGQTVVVPASFFDWPTASELVREGTEFVMWEGREIGKGRVVEVPSGA